MMAFRYVYYTSRSSQVTISNYRESNLTKDTLPKRSDVSFNNVCNHNNRQDFTDVHGGRISIERGVKRRVGGKFTYPDSQLDWRPR